MLQVLRAEGASPTDPNPLTRLAFVGDRQAVVSGLARSPQPTDTAVLSDGVAALRAFLSSEHAYVYIELSPGARAEHDPSPPSSGVSV